jgi:hypothetical protein
MASLKDLNIAKFGIDSVQQHHLGSLTLYKYVRWVVHGTDLGLIYLFTAQIIGAGQRWLIVSKVRQGIAILQMDWEGSHGQQDQPESRGMQSP